MLRCMLYGFIIVSFLAAQAAMADSHAYAVGSCKPRITSFSTITEAVNSVPPGSTILVCPGTYPEQVMISQPLTLQGIASGGQDAAVVTVPPTGLSANAASIFGEPVAAQVLVQTPGPVKIINIGVDGAGSDTGCADGTWVAGIYYGSGSSGAVSRARSSGQMNSGCGAGIWAENDGTARQFVDIGDSSVHDIGSVGVFVAQNGTTPTMFARVHGNTVSVPSGLIGIAMSGVAGTANNNAVSNALFGMADIGTQITFSSNDVRLSSAGIVMQGGGHAVSNQISNSGVGVLFFDNGGTVKGNQITASSSAAIEFSCFTGSARNNTISDTSVGLDQETAMFDGWNSFDNTTTISIPCVVPLALSAPLQGAVAPAHGSPDSIWQWRTPGSPKGALQ